MGFFNVIKTIGGVAAEVGKVAGKAASEYTEKCKKIRDNYERMSDRELLQIVRGESFFSKSMSEKSVAFTILKQRGYSREEIMSKS